MTEEENKKLDIEKRKLRRRMAVVSFVYIMAICTFYILAGIILDGEQAKVLAEFNAVIIAQLATFGALVAGFFGIEYAEGKRR